MSTITGMELFTMHIETDHEKIRQDGRFTQEDFDDLVRAICLDTYFEEKEAGKYYLKKNHDEIGAMLVLDTKFEKLGIVQYLKTWTIINNEDGFIDQLQLMKLNRKEMIT